MKKRKLKKSKLSKEELPSVFLQPTGCCAFTQLRAVGGWTPEALDAILAAHAAEVKYSPVVPGYGHNASPTLWAACVIPGEEALVDALKACGFSHLKSIPRRRNYPTGVIKLFSRTFPKE